MLYRLPAAILRNCVLSSRICVFRISRAVNMDCCMCSFVRLVCIVEVTEFCVCVTRSAFVGVSAKMRKATISFVMSVRPCVRTEQLCCHWKDFHEIGYLSIFFKSMEENEVLFNPDNNNSYVTCRPIYIYIYIYIHTYICTVMVIFRPVLRMRCCRQKL